MAENNKRRNKDRSEIFSKIYHHLNLHTRVHHTGFSATIAPSAFKLHTFTLHTVWIVKHHPFFLVLLSKILQRHTYRSLWLFCHHPLIKIDDRPTPTWIRVRQPYDHPSSSLILLLQQSIIILYVLY